MYKTIIYSPLASLVFMVLSSSFFMTFITVKLNVLNTPESIIGYIHSAFYGGMLVGALKSEGLINRVGYIRSYAVFSSIITITMILQGLFINNAVWIIARFFAGFSISASYVIIESWLLAQSTKKTKGKILAIYMFCLYLSQSASQFFLDLIELDSLEAFLIAAALASISIIPSSVTYMSAPDVQREHNKFSVMKYFKTAPLGFIGCTAAGFILSAIYGFLPSYAQDNNLSVSTALGITIAGGFALQWPIGKLSDMINRSQVIVIIALINMLLSMLLICCAGNTLFLYICFFMFGGISFTIYPVSIAQVCDYFEQGNIINITGVLLFSYGVGSVIGSSVIAFLIEYFTSSVIFYYIAFISVALGIFGIYSILKIEKVVKKDQVTFVAMPRITPIANNLDPRA